MMLSRLFLFALIGSLVACGGEADLICDEGPYLSSARTARGQVPDGLDPLEEIREMPLPEAAPQAPRPADAECIDKPPSIITTR